MSLIEFQTYVHQGKIELPKEYIEHVKGHVRVIIVTSDASDEPDMIQQLLDNPLVAPDFAPLSRDDIYDRQ